jgi:hypothetical protein
MSKSYQEGGRRRKTVKRGGSGAAEYAIKVYGAGDQQHAGSHGNLIAAKAVTGGSYKKGKKGGNALTSVAVPALLIAANHMYKRKGNKTLKKYKKGGAGPQDVLDMAAGAMDNLNKQISGATTPPPAVIQTGAAAPLSSSFGVPVASGGGKRRLDLVFLPKLLFLQY